MVKQNDSDRHVIPLVSDGKLITGDKQAVGEITTKPLHSKDGEPIELDQSSTSKDDLKLSGDISFTVTDSHEPDGVTDIDADEQTKELGELSSEDIDLDKSGKTDDFQPTWRKHQKVSTNPKRRLRLKWLSLIAVVVIIIICVYPTTRHWLLGITPLTRDFSVVFHDQETGGAVVGLQVSLAGQRQTTDVNGKVSFTDVPLGSQALYAEKLGFATIDKNIALEPWTNSQLPGQTIQVVGVRFPIKVIDFLSKKSIPNASVGYKGAITRADKSGQLMLVTPPLNSKNVTISLKASGYHEQSVVLKSSQSSHTTTLEMVSDKLAYFVSNRDGKYGIYSSWLDGSHQIQILAGTGNERSSDIAFSEAPNSNHAVYISTRNAIGDPQIKSSVINELFILDLISAKLSKISDGPITPIGWAGDKFIYITEDRTKSPNSKDYSQLIALDVKSTKQTILSVSNSFVPGTTIIDSLIYFSPSDMYSNSAKTFFSVANPDTGKVQKLISDKLVSHISRVSLSQLQLQANDGDVFRYDINSKKTSASTWVNQSMSFLLSPDGNSSVWAEPRDGQANLILDRGASQSVLFKTAGIVTPIHWINDSLLTFSVNEAGNRLYVIDTKSGKYKDIANISVVGIR